MTRITAHLRKHPLTHFYALAFIISWGGILLIIGGPSGIPGTPEQFKRLLPLAIPIMLLGPTIAGLLMTGLVHGRAGYRELFSHLLKWRAGARWYGIAILTAPLLMTAVPLAISLLFPVFLPGIITKGDKPALLQMGIAAGLLAGIFEEIGWTGFAIPQLRQRYSVLTTGLIMGSLWGAWHFLVNFWSSGSPTGTLSLPLLLHSLLFSIGILPAYRVLMVWVYDRTGSLPVAILMHASLTAGNVILVPEATGAPLALVIWSLVIAAALSSVVAVVTRRRNRA